jgi:hypothetical protein
MSHVSSPRRTPRTASSTAASFAASLASTLVLLALWARGDQPFDDRGSDSSEKAFMVILAITLGTAVTAAAVAFVASKTALFN